MKACDVSDEFIIGSFLIHKNDQGESSYVTCLYFDGSRVHVQEAWGEMLPNGNLPPAPKLLLVSPNELRYRTYLDLNKIKALKPKIIEDIEDPENLTQRQLRYLVHCSQVAEVEALNEKYETYHQALTDSYSNLF